MWCSLLDSMIKETLIDRLSEGQVETFERLFAVFPEDGHEPDQAGFQTHSVVIKGKTLDNAGTDDEIKVIVTRTIDENTFQKFEVRLTDIIALAKHGFEVATK